MQQGFPKALPDKLCARVLPRALYAGKLRLLFLHFALTVFTFSLCSPILLIKRCLTLASSAFGGFIG